MNYSHYFLAVTLAVLASCSIPKLGMQNDVSPTFTELIDTPNFKVKSEVQESVDNLSYAPDKYSGFKIVSNTKVLK